MKKMEASLLTIMLLYVIFLYGLTSYILAADIEGYIVGGLVTNKDSGINAQIVAIDKGSYCSSSVLTQKLLLTAKHCVKEVFPTELGISAGHTESLITMDDIDHLAAEIESHPTADLAMIKSMTPLKLGPKIKRVAVLKRPPVANEAKVFGWGYNSKGTLSPYLKVAKQLVTNYEICRNHIKLDPWELCGVPNFKQSNYGYPFRGDSGGALVVDGYIQIGVVSYGFPSDTERLTVYVNVSYFYDWMVEARRSLLCADNGKKPVHYI